MASTDKVRLLGRWTRGVVGVRFAQSIITQPVCLGIHNELQRLQLAVL
jgi:hypothetical protein